ncbi:MAG TPA: porin, partial [Polyangiaceae bacterium]|nr:porin [Polyangiaceae bacterium]
KYKDFTGRVFAHPLRPIGIEALKDLGVGVAASTGKVEGSDTATALSQYRTSGQQAFFRYRAVSGSAPETVLADGSRNRISPQLYYYYGPFGLLGEYVLSSQRVTLGDTSRVLQHQAWQASGTYVIGGTASYEGVKPDSSIGEGGIGAFEVSARYQGIRLDRDAFPTFADPNNSARDAHGIGVGAGWWANRAARFMLNFESTSFRGGAADGADRASEKIVLARSQISW